MPIRFVHKGNFDKTTGYLTKAKKFKIKSILTKYGEKGLEALREATPKDSGRTADSWSYTIKQTSTGYEIAWQNSSENKGIPIVILIQYGHGTGTGGYVPPLDFINPSIKPIFDEITAEIDKELMIGGSGGR